MTAGPAQIAKAARRLAEGGLVAFPTETVYGLGADGLNEGAVQKVFAIKGRPADQPMSLHISGVAMARLYAAAWSDDARKLAEAFWPGALTLVVPKADNVPGIVTGGGDSVGLRCPAHPTTLALIEVFGKPIVGPSANRSGGVSPTTADHVRAVFSESDVFVLDGGACVAGIESTVLLLDPERARVLRRGPVGAKAIERIIGRPVEEPLGRLSAPHYSPSSPTVIFSPEQWPAVLDAGGPVVVLSCTDRPVDKPHTLMKLPSVAAAYAAAMYAALRRADELSPARIAIERPPLADASEQEAAIWTAIADRLGQAATEFQP